jgi:glutamine cyclotransferase
MLAFALGLGACGGGATSSTTPTLSAPTAAATAQATVAAVATPAPTPSQCPGPPSVVHPPASTAVASGSVLADIRIGDDAFDVTVAGGAVWVASARDGFVKRVNPKTGKVTATIDLGGQSEDSYLLADGTRLWFTRWGKSPSVVGWIDMTTNTLGATYAVDQVPLGLARGRDSIWTTGFDAQTVTELDATTGATRRSIVIDPDRTAPPDVGPTDLVVLGDALWVVGHRSASLVRVDTASGKVTDRLCLPLDGPERLELAFGSLWISDPDRVIVRVDPATISITAVIPLPDYQVPAIRQPWGLAAGADRLWVAAGTVAYWIDPASNTVPGFVQLTDEASALGAAEVYPGAGIENLAVDGDDLFAGFPGIGTLVNARS